MDGFEVWEWFKRLTAIFFLVTIVLYFVRFCATGHLMTIPEYQAYLKGLFLYFAK